MTIKAPERMSDLFDVAPLSFIRTMKDHGEDIRDMLETIVDTGRLPRDWTGDRFRVIHKDDIDDIMIDELESDEYIMGCFNASFLGRWLDEELVTALQEGEKFEALGRWLIDMDYVSGPHGIAAEYAAADGYGHHFAHYDHNMDEQAGGWLVFQTN